MSIQIKDNRKPNFVLQEGVLVKSVDVGDYGILLETDRTEDKYNVVVLSVGSHYPQSAYTMGVPLSRVKEDFTPVSDIGNYDIIISVGKE